MNVKRITRLIRLMLILNSGGAYNATALAKVCSVSRRTVFRDIEALRHAGMPIDFDAEHDRYSFPNAYFLQPINLTPEEALSLVAMASELGHNDRLPFYDSAASAATKLKKSLPPLLQARLRKLRRAIVIQPSQVGLLVGKRQLYQGLVEARLSGKVVRIEYETGQHLPTINTNLRPYLLLFCRHSWYVIGRSSFHSDVRTFNLSRIISLDCTEKRFSVPRDFNIKRYLGNAWQLNPEPGHDHDVSIRFSPLVARNVSEVKWHSTQRLEFQADGSLIFNAQVSGLNEIFWWILAYGDQAEVIRPKELRRLVGQRAKKMVAIYDR